MEDEELELARESSSDIPSLGDHKRAQRRLRVNFQGVFFSVQVCGGSVRNGHSDTQDGENFCFRTLKNFAGGEFEAECQTGFERPGPNRVLTRVNWLYRFKSPSSGCYRGTDRPGIFLLS